MGCPHREEFIAGRERGRLCKVSLLSWLQMFRNQIHCFLFQVKKRSPAIVAAEVKIVARNGTTALMVPRSLLAASRASVGGGALCDDRLVNNVSK